MMTDQPQQKILIVDDEVSYRLMLRGLLEKKGFLVIEAEDGESGVACALEERPHLILMDVNMPRLKGSEAVRVLKETEACKDTPIIVVSGREDSDDLLKCFHYGAGDYVRKVFHHEELLARINTHLSLARLRQELMETNQRLHSDLEYAGEIQQSIQAAVLPETERVVFAGRYYPCEATSGDHYSAFWLDDQHIGICVADASGHGVGAAMLAVFLKGQLENICRLGGYGSGHLRDPGEVLGIVNRSLCEKNFGREFISAVYGILNLTTMEFQFANAGHPYPLLVDVDGTAREVETANPVLGIFADSEFYTHRLALEPGQGVFLYTDGLVETRQEDHEEYGIERLLDLLGLSVGQDPETVADRVAAAADAFRGSHAREDDISLLYFHCRDLEVD
ncbi:MAG: PP2C family protein-serine/threonine phosphatase [Planctomycetota bacterium]|jgi:sigma-B regulation protein RsbU (phosphoserine phosphatase)